MKKTKIIIKSLTAVLAILITLPFLTSCIQNKTIVGKVGDKNVYYDELYFLVNNYKSAVEKRVGENPALVRNELDQLVRENIINNYARLALCEEYGLKYSDIESEINTELDIYIDQNFNGSRSDFRKSCKEFGLSERYVKYVLGLDLLCEQLIPKYIEKGLIKSADTDIIQHIKDNFIRTNHLVIFNDDGDDVQANKAKLEKAKSLLDNGHKINDLVAEYSEDFTSDPDASGYYIAKGTMIEEYENAAFSLDIGQYTDVIEMYSENNYGEYVSCFYIIQRLDLRDDYIDSHFTELKNDYYNSVINNDLQKKCASLSFVPNEQYNKLDLTDLPKSSDLTVVIVICAICVIAIATVITVIIVKTRLKKKNISYKIRSAGRK